MNGFKLISSNQIIGELFSDFNVSSTDWVSKAQRYLSRALGLMQIDGYYSIKISLKAITENRAPLPCGLKYLITTLLYSGGNICRLPLTRSMSLGREFNDIPIHKIYQGRVNDNWLQTNLETGHVIFVYYAIPTDDEGNLLIPDNDLVLEALPYYLIYRMSLSGYKHPVVTREEAYQMWNMLYPRARNSMNYPSIEERDRMMKMNTNPLFVDILNEDWVADFGDFGGINSSNITSVSDFAKEINRLSGN